MVKIGSLKDENLFVVVDVIVVVDVVVVVHVVVVIIVFDPRKLPSKFGQNCFSNI